MTILSVFKLLNVLLPRVSILSDKTTFSNAVLLKTDEPKDVILPVNVASLRDAQLANVLSERISRLAGSVTEVSPVFLKLPEPFMYFNPDGNVIEVSAVQFWKAFAPEVLRVVPEFPIDTNVVGKLTLARTEQLKNAFAGMCVSLVLDRSIALSAVQL